MSCDFLSLATPGVQALKPYLPGKPAEELERELGLENVIKLASNENPLGPSPKVISVLKEQLDSLALYPDSGGYHLKQALAKFYSVSAEKITLGNGSNEVLELIARAFLTPDDEVIYSEHAFVVYSIVTQSIGANAVVTPAKEWGHDLEQMLAAVTDKTRMVFLANPNNPTGTWVTREQLVSFLEQLPQNIIVVLDEAYSEYVDNPDFPNGLELHNRFPNLVITRTFSKAYGLAGLRVGFAVSNEDIANLLSRVREPFNVNSLALVAAEVALEDKQFIDQTVALNHQGLSYFEEELACLGIDFIPSVGNFITVDVKQDAMAVYQAMLQRGVIVRPVANYGMPQHLRISIGTMDENRKCLSILSEVVENSE